VSGATVAPRARRGICITTWRALKVLPAHRRSLRLGEGNGPALPNVRCCFNINYSAQLTTILPAAADAIEEVGPVGSSLACTFCVVRTFGMLLNAGGRVKQDHET
jgi:hypothetical protein